MSGGAFVQCYQLEAILYTASSGFTAPGFDNTPNQGGVYKVWASANPAFPNADSATDNFKVKASVTQQYRLDVVKFYDANANGANDDGQLITGWKVNVKDAFSFNRTPTPR